MPLFWSLWWPSSNIHHTPRCPAMSWGCCNPFWVTFNESGEEMGTCSPYGTTQLRGSWMSCQWRSITHLGYEHFRLPQTEWPDCGRSKTGLDGWRRWKNLVDASYHLQPIHFHPTSSTTWAQASNILALDMVRPRSLVKSLMSFWLG